MATIPTYTSLAELQTNYSRFEKDQVLTHDQLNSVAEFADDQIRLTRVQLLGVGIVAGLVPALDASTVTISRGVGVTTDGDLLALDADTIYDRYKAYDESHPAYAPFFEKQDVNGTRFTLYELVAEDATDAAALSLAGFEAAEERQLAQMTALMLMESYVMDPDLCTGNDCDNLGQEVRHVAKVLLVDRASAEALRESIVVPAQEYGAAGEPYAARAVVSAAVDAAELSVPFTDACSDTLGQLKTTLPALESACSPVLGAAFPQGSAAAWQKQLESWLAWAAGVPGRLQYLLDFLSDVVDACNELREALFDDATQLLPSPDAFPKHLLLGDLVPAATPDPDRTGLYPSPLVSRTSPALADARLLAQRLGAMFAKFAIPEDAGAPILVTPSAWQERPLSERAIPFYYKPDDLSLLRSWSPRLTKRGMERNNYAYHETAYGAVGAAANPLRAQIGRFPFFRIEGHVGKEVGIARDTIEAEIAGSSLPFAVETVLLDKDRTFVIPRPRPRITPLHDLHFLVRQDLAQRLDDVDKFSTDLVARVQTAVAAGDVDDTPADTGGVSVVQSAQQQRQVIAQNAPAARDLLRSSYSDYRARRPADFTGTSLPETVRAAGAFKTNVTPVARTAITTPLEHLATTPHLNWLPWLDQLIDTKGQQADTRMLFSKFVGNHPSLEHFGGVPRGGTFVLVYDATRTVVADFMLPYYVPQSEEELAEPPQLPDLRPIFLGDQVMKLLPSRIEAMKRQLTAFTPTITAQIDARAQVQDAKFDVFKTSYLNVVQDSVNLVKGGQVNVKTGNVGASYNDAVLGAMVDEQAAKSSKLDALQKELGRPDVTDDYKKYVQTQIDDTQQQLAVATQKTAEYIDKANVSVQAGTDGMSALQQTAQSVQMLSNAAAVTTAKQGFTGIAGATQNVALRNFIGGMTFGR